MPPTTARSSRDKVRAHRARMRRKGMRLIQIWVPDVRTRAFRLRAHRDALAVSGSPDESRDQSFVDTISVWPERK